MTCLLWAAAQEREYLSAAFWFWVSLTRHYIVPESVDILGKAINKFLTVGCIVQRNLQPCRIEIRCMDIFTYTTEDLQERWRGLAASGGNLKSRESRFS